MNIRAIQPADRRLLLDIWERSVRATHTFLTDNDIQSLVPLVREYLASPDADFRVLCGDDSEPIGFMGLSPNKIEAMFIAPEFLGQGGGRMLLQHAVDQGGDWYVDVNEQNPAAYRFYERCGFVRVGRSELDSTGRPFPIVHLRYQPG